MSVTITITGQKSNLENYFNPPICLNEDYECALLYFSAYNCIPNICDKNNIFSYGNQILKFPTGSYDFNDIKEYLEKNIKDCSITLKSNASTMNCSLLCTKDIHFDVKNSINSLLGFPSKILQANKWHVSSHSVNIQPVSIIRIACDIVQGSYINGLPSHIVYEFIPNVPSGFQFVEVPNNIVYFPVNQKTISFLNIKILDEYNNNIDFRDEKLQLRLHLRRSR